MPNTIPSIIGTALPNIPWEPKPAGSRDAVWRSSRNPIVPRDLVPGASGIFNSAVVPFGNGFAGVFRIDSTSGTVNLHTGFSADGLSWDIQAMPIRFQDAAPDLPPFEYGYDPRVCLLDGKYYVTWCSGVNLEPTIGVAWTTDFQTYHRIENAFLPYNRNGVLFPRRIGGKYLMLSRPSDNAHTAYGNIYVSESTDLTYWGRHRHVMSANGGWQRAKIGAGPVPLETRAGWLLIYHGVFITCNGMVYSMGAALLDLEKPWQVIARTKPYLLAPKEIYECAGVVPNVVFPVAMLADAATGRLAIYYGGADTVICLAFAQVDELIAFVKDNAQ